MKPYRNNSVKKMKRKRKSHRNKGKPARLGTGGGAKGRWTTTG